MTDKKTRAPKKLTVEAIQKQFDLLTLEDKLLILGYATSGINQEKDRLEKQIALIGGK